MNAFSFDICDLSKYRSALMGIAIIWVVMFHYHFDGFELLAKISSYGYVGVDIFFFLSGLGLYYSMEKSDDIKAFYLKRIKRIFPMYFVLGAVACSLYGDFSDFFWKYSTLGYWTDGAIASWFIPAIVTCYFVYPFVYRGIFKTHDICLFTIFIVFLLFFVSYKILAEGKNMEFDGFQPHWWRLMCWYRLPIFFLGSLVGMWIRQNQKGFFGVIALICLIPAVAFYSHKETMSVCFSTTFMVPFLLMVIVSVIKKFKFLIYILGGEEKPHWKFLCCTCQYTIS